MAVEGHANDVPTSPTTSTLVLRGLHEECDARENVCESMPMSLPNAERPPSTFGSHRRRTSLPSAFRYGSRPIESGDCKPLTHEDTDEHRRPRSFDCVVARRDWSISTPSYWKRLLRGRRHKSREVSTSSSDTLLSIIALESRILREQNQVSQYASRIWAGPPSKYLLQPIQVLLSSRKKENIKVKKLSLVLEAAQRQRSLDLLNDLKISMLQDEEEEEEADIISNVQMRSSNGSRRASDGSNFASNLQYPSPLVHRHSTAPGPLTTNSVRAGASVGECEDTDLMFEHDTLIQVLRKQSAWLRNLIGLRKDKVTSIAPYVTNRFKQHIPKSKPTNIHSGSRQLQQFLDKFQPYSGIFSIPIARDLPTIELVQFEKLLTKYQFIKPVMKDALELLYDETLRSFVTLHKNTRAVEVKTRVFDERDPREIMAFLLQEIVENIMETSHLPPSPYRIFIYLFVEQMVFSRLACACYRPIAFDIDDLNTVWRMKKAQVQLLSFKEIGLAKNAFAKEIVYFQESLFVINQLPYLAPTCILASYMKCIQVIHKEAGQLLEVRKESISADVLLPALVYILSRSKLQLIHSQVYLMEHFSMETLRAWKDEEKGGEIAYYLACLQAAIGYIMNYER